MYASGIAAGIGFDKCRKADRPLFAAGDLAGGDGMEGIKE